MSWNLPGETGGGRGTGVAPHGSDRCEGVVTGDSRWAGLVMGGGSLNKVAFISGSGRIRCA